MDEARVRLDQVLRQPRTNCATSTTSATGGRRARLPEDRGGVCGCHRRLDVLHDQESPEHEGMLEWIGDGFDAACCDLEEVNADLRGAGVRRPAAGGAWLRLQCADASTVAVREVVRPRLPQSSDRARAEM